MSVVQLFGMLAQTPQIAAAAKAPGKKQAGEGDFTQIFKAQEHAENKPEATQAKQEKPVDLNRPSDDAQVDPPVDEVALKGDPEVADEQPELDPLAAEMAAALMLVVPAPPEITAAAAPPQEDVIAVNTEPLLTPGQLTDGM